MPTDVYVYDAVRTPFGRYGGALAGVRPDDLAAHVLRTLVERAPALEPDRVDEIVLGNANGAGEDNRNVARMAGLLAGLPTSVPATTVNRLCGSSLDAAIVASRQIALDEADVVLGRRCGVDEPGALGATQAGEGVPGRECDAGVHHPGLAAGEPADESGVDGLAGRGHRAARDP